MLTEVVFTFHNEIFNHQHQFQINFYFSKQLSRSYSCIILETNIKVICTRWNQNAVLISDPQAKGNFGLRMNYAYRGCLHIPQCNYYKYYIFIFLLTSFPALPPVPPPAAAAAAAAFSAFCFAFF